MLIIEALMLATLGVTSAYCVATDIKKGVVKNRHLFIAAVMVLILDIVYYSTYAVAYLPVFLTNYIIMAAVSVLFYAYNIWAAGDSKLLLFVFLAIPGRLYYIHYRGILPGFILLVMVFGFAFVYIVIDSIIIGISERNLFKILIFKLQWRNYLKDFLLLFIGVSVVNAVLLYLWPQFFSSDSTILIVINLILVLTIINFSKNIGWIIVIISSVLWITLLISGVATIWFSVMDIKPYITAVTVILLRLIAEKYNYQTIDTAHVVPGMILSIATIMGFSGSRVEGLPQATTEDLRSRLSVDEAESIRRWQSSKRGKSQITIVRKVPFAIFIAFGTLAFIIMEVQLLQ